MSWRLTIVTFNHKDEFEVFYFNRSSLGGLNMSVYFTHVLLHFIISPKDVMQRKLFYKY